MARSLNEIIAALPADEQAAVEERYQQLRQEVEGLRELRQIAGKAQEDIASALNIKQPCPRSRSRRICISRRCAAMSKPSAASSNSR